MWYFVNGNSTPLDSSNWLGNMSHRIPFRPHTKKTRKKKLRYKFWKPLTTPFSPPHSSKIHNLSTHTLSKSEIKLLNLGLKFIPPSPPPTSTSILQEFHNLSRSLRLRHFFQDDSSAPHNPFKLPNPSWNPPTQYPPLEDILHKHLNLLTIKLHNTNLPTKHIPLHLLQALKSLKSNKHIIILPADKNVGVCVLNKQTYLDKALAHLSDTSTYKPVDTFPLEELLHRLKTLMNQHLGTLSLIEIKFILHKPSNEYRVPTMYFLPKVHKEPIGYRPICSYNGSLFEQTSKWLHHQLLPILLQQKQYLRDSFSLVQSLENLTTPPNSFIFSFDVESLYPSIPPKLGLLALKHLITPHFSKQKANLIYTLSALTLEYHFLKFNNQIYQQIKGTAMGSNFSVVYACLFLSYLENSNPSPHLFYFTRYIDDAFGVWTGTKTQLLDYLNFYSITTQNSIKLTIQTSLTKLPFLDLWINLANNNFNFNCFQKELNTYQYIPFTSTHPIHVKKSFLSNELKRYIIRESTAQGYLKMQQLFFKRLRARGYPTHFILNIFKKHPYSLRPTLLSNKTINQTPTPIIFKLKFTHQAPNLGIKETLTSLHLNLQEDPLLQHIPKPIICWTKSKNLHSSLVNTKNITIDPH